MEKNVIIYHNADPDGIFSAAICLYFLPEKPVLIGYNYEPEFEHIIAQCHDASVYMVDVSPANWLDMHRLCEVAKQVVWIDHHKTAYLQMSINDTSPKFYNFTPIFEQENWGACRAVWKYFTKISVPHAIELVAKYDVYRDYGTSDWENEILPYRFAVQHIRDPKDVDWSVRETNRLLSEGRAIAGYMRRENARKINSDQKAIPSVFRSGDDTYNILALNGDVGTDMLKEREVKDGIDFVMIYNWQADGWHISLRGFENNQVDLGAIAKQFGGGGHHNAAGFRLQNFDDIKNVIKRHEEPTGDTYILDLIKNDQIEEAIDRAIEFWPQPTLLLQAIFNNGKKQYNMELIGFNEWKRTQEQIKYALTAVIKNQNNG